MPKQVQAHGIVDLTGFEPSRGKAAKTAPAPC